LVSLFTNFWLSFLAGLFAPLGAVCVLPLYPGFLAFLSNKLGRDKDRKKLIYLSLVIMSGIISSMFLIGLIFSFILKSSLTNVIGIISPIAFGILGLVSLAMIFNFDLNKYLPKITSPLSQNPWKSSFLFGFFFGAIVLPCNPASLTILFALSTTTLDFITNMLNFLLFGLGMGLPLLFISLISISSSGKFISWLTRHKRSINLFAGIIMLVISLYYLFFVFRII
jgi:cytochrome c-type biogenesis protein